MEHKSVAPSTNARQPASVAQGWSSRQLKAVLKFLQTLPCPGIWREAQQWQGLEHAEQYEERICSFVDCRPTGALRTREGPPGNSPLEIGRRLATKIKLREDRLHLPQYSHRFLALSYYLVLEYLGYSNTSIDAITRIFCPVNSRDRARLLPAVFRINKLIFTLAQHVGGLCRATEIFVLSAINPSYWVDITDIAFLQGFLMQYFTYCDYDGCLVPGYSNPALLLHLFDAVSVDKRPSLKQICEALGGSEVSVPLEGVYTVSPPKPCTDTCRITSKAACFWQQLGQLQTGDVQKFNPGKLQSLYVLDLHSSILIPEKLLSAISMYFENTCQNMILDESGTLLDQNGAELRNYLCDDFDSYCFTATMLADHGQLEDFRHMIAKATGLVQHILRAEHPRTLMCFFEVFIHFIQSGYPLAADYFRRLLKAEAKSIVNAGSPLYQIYNLLVELDIESLKHDLVRAWECTTDTFERKLSMSARLVVSVRLDRLKRVYGWDNYLEEERLLRATLTKFSKSPNASMPRVMLNLARNLNKQERNSEAEIIAQGVYSLLQEYDIFATRFCERIECKKILSQSQFNQGNRIAAESTIREAIEMVKDYGGDQHPWVLEFETVLLGWLRLGCKEMLSDH